MDEVRGALDQFEKQERELRDDDERREREQALTRILEASEGRRTAEGPAGAQSSTEES